MVNMLEMTFYENKLNWTIEVTDQGCSSVISHGFFLVLLFYILPFSFPFLLLLDCASFDVPASAVCLTVPFSGNQLDWNPDF